MSRHARFDEFRNTGRYTDLYHDALVALWRAQYDQSLRTGTPAPDLPREVEAAVIHNSRRLRSEFLANLLSGGLRRLAGLLRTATLRGK